MPAIYPGEDQADDTKRRYAQSSRSHLANDRAYTFYLSPEDFTGVTPSTFQSRFSSLQLPDAASTSIYWTGVLPEYFRRHKARIILLHSSGTTGNSYDITYRVYGFSDDDALAASPLINSGTMTVSAVGTANDLGVYTSDDSASVDIGNHDLISLRIDRDGTSDSNNGTMELLGVKLQFRLSRC